MKRVIALLILPLLCAGSLWAAVPAPEKLLPPDTLFVLTIPDYAKASASWKQWPASQLWDDPAVKPFREKLSSKMKSDFVEPLEKEFGIKFADYAGLAQGQLTVAVVPDGDKPTFLCLVDSRDKSAALKSNLATLKSKWVDSGKQVRVEKIRDVEFTTLLFKSADLKKALAKVFGESDENEGLETPKPESGGKPIELLVGQSDSLLIVSTAAKSIEKVLAGQSGSGSSALADQANFSSGGSALSRDALAYSWVNTKAIFDGILKSSKGGDGGGGLRPDKLLPAVGLTGLQSVAANVREGAGGSMVNVQLNVPEGGRRGLFKMLSFEAKDANPPPFVPADVVQFNRWRLDLSKAFNTLESTLTEVMPQAAGYMKLIIDAVDTATREKDPSFDLRKNLIANLGDDVIGYEKPPRKNTLADLGSPPSLFLIGSSRPEQVASALRALSAVMPQPKVKEREFLGRKVYAVNLPASPGPTGGKPVEKALHFTASGGYVALSMDVATLEEFMRSSDSTAKALRDNPGLGAAAEKVGGMSSGLFGYKNQAEEMRSVVETLRKESGTLANLFGNNPVAGRLGVDAPGKFKDWVDFSLLPPFDQISKYFYLNVWSGNLTPDGFAFRVYSPVPPQMKK
jgi:hypothetical protein